MTKAHMSFFLVPNSYRLERSLIVERSLFPSTERFAVVHNARETELCFRIGEDTNTSPEPTVPVTTMLSRLAALRIVYGRPVDRDLQAAACSGVERES